MNKQPANKASSRLQRAMGCWQMQERHRRTCYHLEGTLGPCPHAVTLFAETKEAVAALTAAEHETYRWWITEQDPCYPR